MINNTSRQRWQRAEAGQLDTQFMMAITHGMNCSPFEAEAVCDAVYEVYGPLLETSDALQPGQPRGRGSQSSVAGGRRAGSEMRRIVTHDPIGPAGSLSRSDRGAVSP